MNLDTKEMLVKNQQGLTLEGVPCHVSGWLNDRATIAPDCGGFWHTEWETVKNVSENGKNFTADDVSFTSWGWIGDGTKMPPRLAQAVQAKLHWMK